MNESTRPRLPHVVVLGAGFGGLYFAKAFPSERARVTVIDRQNHHLFQPLLYQVATAGLGAPDIAQPIRAILRKKPNLTVLMAEVKRLLEPWALRTTSPRRRCGATWCSRP